MVDSWRKKKWPWFPCSCVGTGCLAGLANGRRGGASMPLRPHAGAWERGIIFRPVQRPNEHTAWRAEYQGRKPIFRSIDWQAAIEWGTWASISATPR